MTVEIISWSMSMKVWDWVGIISWSMSMKVWDRVGIELDTPGSALRHITVVKTRNCSPKCYRLRYMAGYLCWNVVAVFRHINTAFNNFSAVISQWPVIIWASVKQNRSSGLLTKRDSNQSPQLQTLARKLKFSS